MVKHSSALDRIIRPRKGNLPRQLAEFILSLDFPASDHTRYARLSRKAQQGTLSQAEREYLDDLLAANAFLGLIQSKARISLGKRL